MTPSEIAFLALGLVLGVALGASFLAAVRSRPARRREVRVTITPNSLGARRAATLADPIMARDRRSPPGSPGDAGWPDNPDQAHPAADVPAPWAPGAASPMRTRVPSVPARLSPTAVGIPVDPVARHRACGPGRRFAVTPGSPRRGRHGPSRGRA